MQLRGLLCIPFLVCLPLAARAGQEFHFVDLDPWHPTGLAQPNTGIRITRITSTGAIAFVGGFGPASAGRYATCSRLPNGSSQWVYDRTAYGTNSHGDFVYNGGVSLSNFFDENTGGTIRYANGTDYVMPASNGKTFCCTKDINDDGVVVGHYSTYLITNTVQFYYGVPFYMKNGVISMPFGADFQGTFNSVDKYGRAILDRGGYWSPENGYVNSAYLYGGGYNGTVDVNDQLQSVTSDKDPENRNYTVAFNTMTSRTVLRAPSFIPLDSTAYGKGGLNNFGKIVFSYYRPINGGVRQHHWCYWNGAAWEDLYAAVQSQVPSGWLFNEVKDIDDYGRVYGTMTKPDGSMTIVRLDPVPEPTTLAALGLGALLLRRKKSATKRAA